VCGGHRQSSVFSRQKGEETRTLRKTDD